MAIARNYRQAGLIDAPGEYKVSVEKVEVVTSSKGKRMLKITFITADERRIRGFYVAGLKWHMDALRDLNIACGLKPDDVSTKLMGLSCGIAVGEGKVSDSGHAFMQIEGYGKASDVSNSPPPSPADFSPGGGTAATASDFALSLPDDGVPF